MLPLFYRKYVPWDTMYPTAPTMAFWYVMLSVRDLIRVFRFPLQEVSDWISLARASQLDYGAVAEVSLYLAGGFLRGLPLLYSPECVEEEFSEVRLLRGHALRCGSWHHTHRGEWFDPLGS